MDLIGDWMAIEEENCFFSFEKNGDFIFYEDSLKKEHNLNHEMGYTFVDKGDHYILNTFFLNSEGYKQDYIEYFVEFFTSDSIELTPIEENDKGKATEFIRLSKSPPAAARLYPPSCRTIVSCGNMIFKTPQ